MSKKIISAALAALLVASVAAVSAAAEEVTAEPAGATVTVEKSGTTGKFKFDASSWNSNNICFYIWDETTGLKGSKDGWVEGNNWGSKKIRGTKLEDGIFESYEIDIPEGDEIYVIFHDPDTNLQTFDCVLNPSAIDDTARLTGNNLENPVDSEKKAAEVLFDNSGLTAKLCITSSGKVQGSSVVPGMNKAKEVAKFILKYQGTQEKLTNADVVTQDTVNAALSAFGVSGEEVFAEYQALNGEEGYDYKPEKEKEAKTFLGISDGDTESKADGETESKTDSTASTGSTASTASTASTGSTAAGTASKAGTTTKGTAATTGTTGTTAAATEAAASTGDTTGTATFAVVLLGAAVVMFAARKKVEE